jgi:uncharacterized UPF0160 family protein
MKCATHNGVFHADDVFAAALLRRLFANVEIIRTRDPKVIAAADLTFDVGGEYDPSRRRFDHHQRDFNEEVLPGVPLSSVGLLWREYGEQFAETPFVADKVYRDLIAGIDAVDNGVRPNEYQEDYARSWYCPTSTVSAVIARMNPAWDSGIDPDAAFERAVELADQILVGAVLAASGEERAHDKFVRACWRDAAVEDGVVVLDRYLPWTQMEVPAHAFFIVFPGSSGGWMVQQVPTRPGGLVGRVPLPEEWAGLRDGALQTACGVPDATFCHAGRFIGGAASRDGAVRMAQKAIYRAGVRDPIAV